MKTQLRSLLKTAASKAGFLPRRQPRKVCFLITNRIHYARQKILLQQLRGDPDITLQLIVGGSALLEKYGSVIPSLERRGFAIQERMVNLVEGGNHAAMAKTAGLAVLELTNTFEKLNPDMVLIRGDRFEQLAAAMTAAYLNKMVVHIEGGDVTGTIDESVRHAITKLAHVHLVTNDDSYRRIIQMGENPAYVFNVGSPDIEFASRVGRKPDAALIERSGVGGHIDITQPYIIVIQHPVTSEADNLKYIMQTLQAVNDLGVPTLWFWPNPDAGTDAVSGGIRRFREHTATPHIRFLIDLMPNDFIALLRQSACLVGNSSSGIKEASFFGVPVVNVGSRQHGRLRAENVLDVGYDALAIRQAIQSQMSRGRFIPSLIYYKRDTSKLIRRVLKTVPLYTQKRFFDVGGRGDIPVQIV